LARDQAERTTLARLITDSSQGLEVRRVLEWADQLAAAIDRLHARGRRHGSIDPSSVYIDEQDRAHLAVETRSDEEPTERDLLLGDAGAGQAPKAIPVRPEDDVRALAATLYEALGGDRLAKATPASLPPPVPGVSVQINLALLGILSRAPGRRVTQAGDLARMLRGGPAPARRHRGAPQAWINRVAVTLVAAAAVVSVIAGVRLWIGPTPAQLRHDEPVPSGDLLAADQEIKAALAARAREQPPVVVPEHSAVEPVARREAIRDVERAADAWQQALACAPDPWLHDDAVQAWCAEAMAVAEDAWSAARAARYEQATRDYELAALLLAEAAALHDQGVAELLAESAWARGDGQMAGVLNLLNEAASFAGPEQIDTERVETFLAMAWTMPSAPAPATVEQVVDAAPAPDEEHAPAPATVEQVVDAAPAPDEEHAPAPALAPAPDVARRGQRTGAVRVNALSQTMILVEPGEFAMGSPHAEPLRDEGEWQHVVQIAHAFWMSRVEVTRGQFASFVKENRYVTDAERAGWSHSLGADGRWRQMDDINWRDPGFTQSDSHPVVCVSLHDALAFCRWLSDLEGRTYRLPTEAEWEYACRAGSLNAFAWGDDVFDELPRANAADKAWTDQFPEAVGFRWRDECVFTSPVGRFPANAWGLFDMHGNVAEWCLDRYVPYGVEPVVDAVAPEAMSAGDQGPRVMRGGSFAATPAQCRAAHRDAGPPGSSFVTVGFRVVMESDAD
jgi:formylglycine-generating enzyme required for sulfatase activity